MGRGVPLRPIGSVNYYLLPISPKSLFVCICILPDGLPVVQQEQKIGVTFINPDSISYSIIKYNIKLIPSRINRIEVYLFYFQIVCFKLQIMNKVIGGIPVCLEVIPYGIFQKATTYIFEDKFIVAGLKCHQKTP